MTDSRHEGWVRLTEARHCACFGHGHKIAAGSLIRVTPAYNQPQEDTNAIRYWVDMFDPDECYGIGLRDGDWEGDVFNANYAE